MKRRERWRETGFNVVRKNKNKTLKIHVKSANVHIHT